MRLQARLTVVFACVLLVYLAFHFAVQRHLIIPNLESLEAAEALEDLDRCIGALQRELHHLDRFANDWAAWDDTYRFMAEHHADYIGANLLEQTFRDNQLALIGFWDPEGRPAWVQGFHPDTATPLTFAALEDRIRRPLQARLARRRFAASETGLATTEHGTLLLAACPILTSERRGPARGMLIMGRLLTEDLVRSLNGQTRVAHRIWTIAEGRLPEGSEAILPRIRPGVPYLRPVDARQLAVFATLADLEGRAGLLFQVEVPRRIYTKGLAAERVSLASDVAVGLSLLAVLLFGMRRMVVRPLSALTGIASRLRETDDLSLRAEIRRTDEIGELAAAFNQLVARLQESRQGLEQTVDARTAELQAANRRLTREIGEREKAEAALQQARDRLERLVAERTAELVQANARLEKAIRKRLEKEKKLRVYQQSLQKLSSRLQLAEEQERRRIATDLHDGVGQTLTIAKLHLDQAAAEAPPENASRLALVSARLDQAIQGTRMLTFELSPPILYDLGLEAALEWLCEQVQQHGLTVEFADDGQPKPLGLEGRVMLFQIARELLFNVVKHARARRAGLDIRRSDGTLQMTCTDDGQGFDTARIRGHTYRTGGFGLFSIRERLRDMQGRMDLESGSGCGTRITITAPLALGAGAPREETRP